VRVGLCLLPGAEVKAATDIGYCMPFTVAGINATNPKTYEDTGLPMIFATRKAVKAGEEVTDYWPLMHGPGSMYQNVTRVAEWDDLAVEGWPK
jgi:hypothetical protein